MKSTQLGRLGTWTEDVVRAPWALPRTDPRRTCTVWYVPTGTGVSYEPVFRGNGSMNDTPRRILTGRHWQRSMPGGPASRAVFCVARPASVESQVRSCQLRGALLGANATGNSETYFDVLILGDTRRGA
jgi:hypothetical protein